MFCVCLNHSRPWTTGGWVAGEKRVNDRLNEMNSFLYFTHSFSHLPTHPGNSGPGLTVHNNGLRVRVSQGAP